MIEKWLTIDEAAELEGIPYETMKKKIQRNQGFRTENDISDDGGRARVYIALSSLSAKARRLFRQQAKIDISAYNDINDENVPWYIKVDWGAYREKNKRHFNKAIEMKGYVEECIAYSGTHKTAYIKAFAEKINLSERSLQRRIKDYMTAKAWAIELGKEDNKNYDFLMILALCPKQKEKAEKRALNEEMKAIIENIWFNKDFATNLCKYAKLYRIFCDIGREKDWCNDIPSYSTVVRYIKEIRYTTDNARVMLERGNREFRRVSMVKARRDLKMLRVMELVVADTHTFDCFVSVTDINGKRRAVKPCLVGFMDMRSRALVGWSICEIPNSQVIKETMISMVLEKKNKANPFSGVPKILLIDNGKDYTAETLTGRKRNVRVDIDEETEGFYKELGIERDMRSLPYQAWTKGQIERFFGSVCEDFTKDMQSYVGTLTGSKTSGKVTKNIKDMFEKGMLMDIGEFAEKFEYWVLEVYSRREHKGLKEQKEKYHTPIEVYRNEERYFKAAPPAEYLERIAMVKVTKKVYATGIRLFGCDYMSEELMPYINAKRGVIVRYNRNDVTEINVYDADDNFICKAANAVILDPLAPIGDTVLVNHIKEQKRHERMAREIIEKGTMSYEERMTAENMLISKKAVMLPETDIKQKITRMPENKKYIEDKKKAEEEKEIDAKLKAFYRKEAKEVLDKMKIGG